MADSRPPETDPTAPEYRDVGAGLLEEEMGPSSSLAHLYRGEVHRMKFWRERLDRTTNWAVILMAAVLTWAFSSPDNPHYIILIGMVATSIFLVIEARRYRDYDGDPASGRSRRTSSPADWTRRPIPSIPTGASA